MPARHRGMTGGEEDTEDGKFRQEDDMMVVACSSSIYFTPDKGLEGTEKVGEEEWLVQLPIMKTDNVKVEQDQRQVEQEQRQEKQVKEDVVEEKVEAPVTLAETSPPTTVVSKATFYWSGIPKHSVDKMLHKEVCLEFICQFYDVLTAPISGGGL